MRFLIAFAVLCANAVVFAQDGRPSILWSRGVGTQATAMALTGDGSTLYILDNASALRRMKTANGEVVHVYQVDVEKRLLAVSPDGTKLVTVRADSHPTPGKLTIQVRNPDTMEIVATTDILPDPSTGLGIPHTLRFSPNGEYLAVIGLGYSSAPYGYRPGFALIRVSDMNTVHRENKGNSVIYTHDSSQILVGSNDATESLEFRATSDGSLIRSLPAGYCLPFAIHPSGSVLMAQTSEGYVLLDPSDGHRKSKIPTGFNDVFEQAEYIGTTSQILISSRSYYESSTNGTTSTQATGIYDKGHWIAGKSMDAAGCPIVLYPKAKVAYMGFWGATLKRFDYQANVFSDYPGPGGALGGVDWTSDGSALVSGGVDLKIGVWKPSPVSNLSEFRAGGEVSQLVASPDSKSVAWITEHPPFQHGSRYVHVSGLDGVTIFSEGVPPLQVALGWAADGLSLLMSAPSDAGREIRRIRLSDHTDMWKRTFDNAVVSQLSILAASPDGTKFYGLGKGKGFYVFDATTGELLTTVPRTTGGDDFQVDTFNNLVVSALLTNPTAVSKIEIRDATTLALLRTVTGPVGTIKNARITLDGKRLIVSYPGRIHILDSMTGGVLATYTDDVGPGDIYLALSPDGSRFAFGRSDGTLSVARDPFYVDSTAPTSVIVDGSPVGGTLTTATVTINQRSPVPVTLKLISTAPTVASVPATVTIPRGATSATFPVKTFAVDGNQLLRIRASYGGKSAEAKVTVRAPGVASIRLVPESVKGGRTVTVRVTLDGRFATKDAVVQLTASDGMVFGGTTAWQVNVTKGTVVGTVVLTTGKVTETKTLTLTATLGGRSAVATLTITP